MNYFYGFLNDQNKYKYLSIFDWDDQRIDPDKAIIDSNPVQSYVSSAPAYLVDGHWIWEADGTGYATIIESTGYYSTYGPTLLGTRATIESIVSGSYPPVGTAYNDNTTDPNGRSVYSSVYDLVEIDPTTTITIIADESQPYTGSGLVALAVVSPYPMDYTLTYDGSATPPTEVGTYNLYAYINIYPSINTSKIIKIVPAQASINIDIPSYYYYNGNEITPYVTTSPEGLSYSLKYNGGDQKPNSIGQWKIDATITEANYVGSSSKSLFVYEDCSNGIVAYYTLDEASGTREDVTGSYPLLEYNGPIGSDIGVIKQGLNITDANQYLLTNNFPLLKQFSVYFWVKSEGQNNCIIIGTSSISDRNWFFYLHNGSIYIYLGNYQNLNYPFNQDGEWHFVCAVFDQYEEGKVSLYVDGNKIKSNSDGPISTSTAYPVIINNVLTEKNGVFSIDEVGIFQRALSDKEVSDMYLRKQRPVYNCNPLCHYFYMQPTGYRICAETLESLYTAVENFRVNVLHIPAGYVHTDVDSFLWAQNLNTTNIPVSGWNYCEGCVRITGVTREDLYRAVAAYRQDNGIPVGNWLNDVDTYLAGLTDSIGHGFPYRYAGRSPFGCGC